MFRSNPTPLGAAARGLIAGVVGTAAMTLHQELVSKLRDSGSDAGPSKSDEQKDPWKSAPAPAVVARRILEGVFRREVPAEKIGLAANVMHWAYGVGWGAVFGLVAGSSENHPLKLAPPFGAAVWAASYAQLVPMGLYEPPWTYSPQTLANDLGYHLTYGVGVAAGYTLADRVP